MEAALIATSLLALAAVVFAFVDRAVRDRDFAQERKEWNSERQWLLNRIQHPSVYQPSGEEMPDVEQPQEIEEDYGKVGTIQLNGNGDEPDA